MDENLNNYDQYKPKNSPQVIHQAVTQQKPKKPLHKKWWFWVLVCPPGLFCILIMIALVSVCTDSKYSSNKETTSVSVNSKEEPKEPKKETVISVDYKVLFNDYEDNPIAADEKYRNKKLEITGPIKKIGREIMQKPYVTIAVKEYFGSVNIYFNRDEEQNIAELKKGQKIRVQGTCTGLTLGNVCLNDCILKQVNVK